MSAYAYEEAARRIISYLHVAERSLLGASIVTTNGEAGTVREIKVDDEHGLRFTIDDPNSFGDELRRWYPVSTIKQRA